jgi:hypothetical protein
VKFSDQIEVIRSCEDLKRFPLINKRMIQAEPAAFVAAGLDVDCLHASRTSGGSGHPTTTHFVRPTWLLTRCALKPRRIAAIGGWPLLRRVLIVSEQCESKLSATTANAPSGMGVLFQAQRP